MLVSQSDVGQAATYGAILLVVTQGFPFHLQCCYSQHKTSKVTDKGEERAWIVLTQGVLWSGLVVMYSNSAHNTLARPSHMTST